MNDGHDEIAEEALKEFKEGKPDQNVFVYKKAKKKNKQIPTNLQILKAFPEDFK